MGEDVEGDIGVVAEVRRSERCEQLMRQDEVSGCRQSVSTSGSSCDCSVSVPKPARAVINVFAPLFRKRSTPASTFVSLFVVRSIREALESEGRRLRMFRKQ